MSKTGQAFYEGQVFAEENFNESRNVFVDKAEVQFGKHTFKYNSALYAFDEIQSDLNSVWSSSNEQ